MLIKIITINSLQVFSLLLTTKQLLTSITLFLKNSLPSILFSFKSTYFCHFCARDYDGKVTPEEVASAAMYLKDTLGKEGIQELISNLSKDKGQWQ
jgi:hypothetical protein